MRHLQSIVIALVALFAATASMADTPVFSTKAGAIRGYDPVAYFKVAEPVKGSAEFTVEWNGATWRFSSAENRDAFRDDPEHYAPQYGGHCAYAMSEGRLASTDPDAWRIVDGKLYLNFSKRVQRRWLKDVPGYIEKADAEWAAKYAISM